MINTITIFLFSSFFMIASCVQGQTLVDDTRELKVLLFENLEKGKRKIVSLGATVRYKLDGEKRLYKGIVEAIGDDFFVVDNKKILFRDCAKISGRVYNENQILGGVLTGIGVASISFGGTFLATGSFSVGVASVVTAAALIGVGIYIVMQHKTFNLNKGWTVHGATIRYNPNL